jgi:hypothetical protein
MEQQGVPRATDDQPHDPYQSRQAALRAGPLPGLERQGVPLANIRASGNREGFAAAGLQEEPQGSIILHPTVGQPLDYQNGGTRALPQPGRNLHQAGPMNGTNGGSKTHHRGGAPHLTPIVDTNSSGVSSPSSRSMSPTHA